MHLSDVLVSLSGVVLVVGLVWWTMGSAVARIGDEAAARARIAPDHPDFVTNRLLIAADQRSALALSADGREAILLFALGSRVTLWRMPRNRLRAELRETALIVHTHDFTLPRLCLPLTDATQGREITTWLNQVTA